MFRGKESSNRIELSRLVQDLLNFGVLGSLGVDGGGGWLGVHPTHMHMHACVCTRMRTHAHARVVNMIISCKWPPSLGEYLQFPMMSYVHVHVCACACVWQAPSHHPPPISTHPPTPKGGTPGISQNSIALELIEIFQFCLKI